MSQRTVFAPLVFALAVVAAPSAQAQVCSGISEASDTPLTTVRVVSGLSRTLFVAAPPGDVERLFVVEQDGRIRILRGGALLAAPFLDIASVVRSPADLGGGNEEGLLGLAFHPQYAANGWFFVYHTNAAGNNVLARYTVSGANPDLADTASRVEAITFSHPTNSNHNGGMIAFNPTDGYLYIGTGDGGGGCDSNNNAQTLTSRLGKLHRIDVNALPYTIPADNPFAGGPAGDDEVWSYGLRNPYRWSFDRGNGDLYIGDVGQGKWEEVDWQAAPDAGKARNFGWRSYEGTECPNPSCGNVGSCSLTNNTLPVLQYLNQAAPECSITGGYVYRGCRMPALRGTYFYSDYCSAFIRSLRMAGGVATDQRVRTAELAPGGSLAINSITSYGEDGRGELYVVDQGGEVFKIVPVLSNLEVSGSGASPFQLSRDGDWTWENLQSTSSHPIVAYKVYRSNGNGSATFDCLRQQAGTVWAGGDPQNPAADSLFSYLVTAVNAAGVATSPGTGTGGSPRTLSATACP
jgi:glucose/arabinose dehydrogenase